MPNESAENPIDAKYDFVMQINPQIEKVLLDRGIRIDGTVLTVPKYSPRSIDLTILGKGVEFKLDSKTGIINMAIRQRDEYGGNIFNYRIEPSGNMSEVK